MPQWTAGGVPLCTAPDNQLDAVAVADGAGGAIVTWNDSRGGAYAQRVSPGGLPQWTAEGVALCTTDSGTLTNPTIISDDTGGAILSWHDLRNGTDTDIYTQRVNDAGVPQWTPNGVALCTSVNNQALPTGVSDGAGGAIVTWFDARNGNNDIYAQQVDPFGHLGGAKPVSVPNIDSPIALSLASPRPNPAREAVSIQFELPRPTNVSLLVYDAGGRSVRMLFRSSREAGRFALPWDLRDDTGHKVPSGVYFLHLEAAGDALTRRFAVMR